MALVVLLLELLVGASAPPGRGAEAVPPPLGELADQYRQGDRDDAVAAVTAWTEREVEGETEALLEDVEARARADGTTPEERARGRATLQAAATLLGDSARRSLYRGDRPGARALLRAAERLARGARSPESPEFARRFTLFEGLLLHAMGDLSGAFVVLSEGRRSLEDDAELLLALGAVSEAVSALRVYDVPDAPRPLPGEEDAPRFVIEGQDGEGGALPRTSLADAQALLAKALKRDPGMLEARLRLGRVLLLRGRTREALPDLVQAGQESASRSQRYLARLFEGRTRERLGDMPGAAAAYAAAAETVPQAQSARIALGRALALAGENRRAQEAF
ncbi:MAG TPA: tetratricopeptide repeat protein, partial [Vicinamibacteria bacterium]